MVSFETMIMMMNEGMHKEGILSPDRYVTTTEFIAWMIASCIVIVLFDYLFFDEKYDNTKIVTKLDDAQIVFSMMGWGYIFFTQYLLFKQRYDDLLMTHGIFIPFILVLYIVATKKEFEGLWRFLEEKFGWLF